MERDELASLMELIQDDALAILENQAALSEVKDQLRHNQNKPFEQDFIYVDNYGDLPSKPHRQTIAGIEITTQVLHQTGTGLRDIAGADLLYEIESEKYALIQYNISGRMGRSSS